MEENKNQAMGMSSNLGGNISMTDDAKLIEMVRNALIVALPEDTPGDVIEEATLSVMQLLHSPWFPMEEKRTIGPDKANGRAAPNGKVIAVINKGTGVRAGESENGWRPCLLHFWISNELVS